MGKSKKICRLTDFYPKTSLMYMYIVRCYVKLFHLVVVDVNDLICIFMNIYENFKNDRKINGKKKSKQRLEISGWVVMWFLFGYTALMFEYTVRTSLCFLIYIQKVIHHFPAHIFPIKRCKDISLSFLL